MRARIALRRSWLVLVTLAATLVLLAGLITAGTQPGGSGTTLGAGTVKPKPPR